MKHHSYFYKHSSKSAQKPPRKWIILPTLWKVLKRVCMGLGALLLISLVTGFFSTYYLMQKTTPDVPDEMLLFYRIEGELIEGPVQDGFNAFRTRSLSLKSVLDTLDTAAHDDRVKALIVNARKSTLSIAKMQELRQAIVKFRAESGKPAYIYSLSFSEAGGLPLYSFASAFDAIWMHPLGTLSIEGLRLEQPYFKELLDKLGIRPQFYQREEYKGVFDMVKAQSMPEATRESLESLSEDLVDKLIADILKDRPQLGAQPSDFMNLVNQGVFLDQEALDAKLVDRVAYGDVLLDDLRKKLGGDVNEQEPALVAMADYMRVAKYEREIKYKHELKENAKKEHIAVIFVEGPIMILSEGESGNSLFGTTSLSADQISGLIAEAGENDATKAIVVRVNSPGGSPIASEIIRRAVVKVREKGKPVIVSMGDVAASGGYWVSASADYIFANPGTLTGSIGVAGGKASLRDMWPKIHVNWDHVQIGEHAGMNSMNEPFSPQEVELVQKMMSNTYDMFLHIVAQGRDMTLAEARDVAKGRVWTGAQALGLDLVDQLGGFNDALDYAAQQVGKESRKDIDVFLLPEPKSPLEELLKLLSQTASVMPLLHSTAQTLEVITTDRVLQDLNVMGSGEPVLVYESGTQIR
jgi:protease IV